MNKFECRLLFIIRSLSPCCSLNKCERKSNNRRRPTMQQSKLTLILKSSAILAYDNRFIFSWRATPTFYNDSHPKYWLQVGVGKYGASCKLHVYRIHSDISMTSARSFLSWIQSTVLFDIWSFVLRLRGWWFNLVIYKNGVSCDEN